MPSSSTTTNSYWAPVWATLGSLLKGMKLSMKHLRRLNHRRKPMHVSDANYFQQPEGPVTIQYPREEIPSPVHGRYRLYMETEDCIGCDQCARICPVDCIDIVKIKATQPLGTTSDGTKKLFYLPTFDIDMAKCCYCGLCTVVCPTECLWMTPVYDYSETSRDNLVYSFGNLSPAEAEVKQRELAEAEAAKAAARADALKKAKETQAPTTSA